MSVKFRNNCNILQFGDDYYRIRSFLIALNRPNWLFGRWDWMITHLWLDQDGISKIGVWEDKNQIVALATYDTELGRSYFNVFDEYRYLKAEMLEYSTEAFSREGDYKALISDEDRVFQDIATSQGFQATEEKEHDAIYPIELEKITYTLPSGFKILSLSQNFDIYKYGQVLWKGFNHERDGEGEYNPTNDKLDRLRNELERPNVDLDTKIAVVAPSGDFVSYCGMWFDSRSEYCLVEPVATDPDFRRLGLGRAAVLEGIRKCGLLGAKTAVVGSSQQFYYSIGFRPYGNSTWWGMKKGK